MLRTKVQKWGNSAAIHLPTPLLEAAELAINQTVEIMPQDGGLFIRSVEALPGYALDELLAGLKSENLNSDQLWISEHFPPE